METSATIVRNGVSTTIRVTITFPDEYSPDKLQIVSNPVLIYEPNIDIKIPIPDVDNVYLIRQGNTNKYKIGHSIHPYKRISPLQTGNSEKLEIVACCAGGVIREGYLHDKYKKNKRINEWFEFNDEEANLIIKEFRSYRLNPDVPCNNRCSPQKIVDNEVDQTVAEQKQETILNKQNDNYKDVNEKRKYFRTPHLPKIINYQEHKVPQQNTVDNKSSEHILIDKEFFLKQITVIEDNYIYRIENQPFIFTIDLYDIYFEKCIDICPGSTFLKSLGLFAQQFKSLNPGFISGTVSIDGKIRKGYFIPELFYNVIQISITSSALSDGKMVTLREWMDNYTYQRTCTVTKIK